MLLIASNYHFPSCILKFLGHYRIKKLNLKKLSLCVNLGLTPLGTKQLSTIFANELLFIALPLCAYCETN